MKRYCVYTHIAPNGKIYIGITCQKPERRWHGGSGYRNQPKFYNAIKKYGWANFFHGIILENLSEENASAIEQFLIREFDTINNGYNQTSGGIDGYTYAVNDTTRQKISHALAGRKLSPEHKIKACEQLSKNRAARQRKVYCVETNDYFNSIQEAADAYDLSAAHINECCAGTRKTHGKLHWKYWEVDDGEMGRDGLDESPMGRITVSS